MKTYRDLIDATQLKGLLTVSDYRLIDCRSDLMQPEKGRADYLVGHLPGAVYADLDVDLADPVTATSGRHPLPDAERFRKTLAGWGISNDTQVVAYDYANSALAARLWWMLRWMGHDRVAVLDGGIAAWSAAGGELQTTVPQFEETVFNDTPKSEYVATTEEISAALAAGTEMNLVDAREAARFFAQTEPIDTVAGHVPGAINYPLSRNLNSDGTWRSGAELARVWRDVLDGRPIAPLIAMCGSGVTACHLVLSAQMAGLAEPRVYVGSWSEWIRDPARPVATTE
jgi:thiosulfate/3-mercaptopyruvate sulfurtransferase